MHWLRDGELSVERLENVPRPTLLDSALWNDDGTIHYAATKWSLVDMPSVEPTPWAGRNAARISEDWIDSLKMALTAIAYVPTERWRYQPEVIAAMINNCFGPRAPRVAKEWRVAHGDLQWSNVTAPTLSLLDWECWGHAPRGYDAAYLIAVSCANLELVDRLERAFADELNTESGQVARLVAVANLIGLIKAGWLDPQYSRPLRAMGRRVLSAR
jgi:hypothetical protein